MSQRYGIVNVFLFLNQFVSSLYDEYLTSSSILSLKTIMLGYGIQSCIIYYLLKITHQEPISSNCSHTSADIAWILLNTSISTSKRTF